MTTTIRLAIAAALAISVGLALPATTSADFDPDLFDPATAGTSGIYSQDMNTSTVGGLPAGWTGSGWAVRSTALASTAPAGNIPVLDGNFVALDNSVATAGGTMTSPIIDLTATLDPYLTFNVHSFFVAGDEGNQGYDTDKSYVQINVLDAAGGLIDQVFELGDTDLNGAAGWLPQTVRLADFAGQQIRLQVVYVDEGATSNNDQHDIALDDIAVVDVAAPDGSDTLGQPASATYFLPISDADVSVAQSNIFSNEVCGPNFNGPNPGPQDTVTMLTSITIGDTPLDAAGNPTSAVVLYDHVEDGLGSSTTRTQSTTELWGDGDPSNGFAPGHPDDLLFPGEVVILRTISDPGVSSPLAPGAEYDSFDSTSGYTLDYDAGDRLTSPTGLVITRVGWNDGSSTLLAGAVEVADTSAWGNTYELPVGENLGTLFPNTYDYTGASIMARANGTVVTLPDGTAVTLDAGESYFVDGGLLAGDTITSTGGSISVNLLTGDPCSTFQGRWFRIDPVRLFDDVSFTPVAITDGSNPIGGTSVAVYNPGDTAITVTITDEDGVAGSVTVPAGGTARYDLTDAGSGARLESDGGEPFYAVQNYDTGSTQRDWGFALLGLDQLSPTLQAGLAIGVDPTSTNTTAVYSPLWVMAIWNGDGPAPAGGVDICIDWNGDGGANTIPGTSLEYDTHNTDGLVADLDNVILNVGSGAPTNDLTGTKVFTCNPTDPTDPALADWLLAGAWGQDTSGPGGSPSIDVGTGVFNLPSFALDKALVLIEDDNANGITDVGDTVRYDLTVTNTSGVTVLANRLKVWDNLPPELDYIEGSTVITPELAPLGGGDPEAVPDDVGGLTAFPLDDADDSNLTFDDPNDIFTDSVDDGVWWNRRLAGGDSFTISFDAEILQVPANNAIVNIALATDGRAIRSDQVSFIIPEFVTIGDRVWLDEDGDGIQDAGEDGIAGVPVTLTYTLADGTVVTLDTVTDADGGYVFTDMPVLPAGDTYTVTIAAPAGMDPTYDEDGGLDLTITLVSDPLAADTGNQLAVQPGEEHMTADFGLNWVPPVNTDGGAGVGAIGDRVWADVDGDGIQDAGEAGIGGVTVTLLDADGTVVATAVTDVDGTYIFDDLPAGAYQVVVDDSTLPDGLTQTGDPDDTVDHSTDLIVLAPGDVYLNADFGYQPSDGSALDNTIGDTVWLDGDGDGAVGPDEPGLPGVTVTLLDDTGAVVATTTTDENGNYLFTGVPAGDYQVWVNDTDNVLGELAPISDPDGTLDDRTDVTVTGGDDIVTADFGYAPPDSDPAEGLIGDTVFLDRDGDGLPGAGEGIEGVRVELYDEFDRLVGVTYTNETGFYAFGDLDPTVEGQYRVEVDETTLPDGLAQSVDPDGDLDGSSSTPLAANEQIYTLDFGYVATEPATLSGTIWEDADADGVLEADETGRFDGVTVVLTQLVEQTVVITDPDTQEQIVQTQIVEQIVATTTTDANGDYSFDGLSGGDYVVRVTDEANVVGGYWHSDAPTPGTDGQSQDDEGYAVTVPAGGTDTTADFGYYIEPGAVGDTVFNDADGNGTQGAGEPGIPGAVVQLEITYPDGTVTLLTTTTDANGNYEFANLLLDEDHNGDPATAGAAEPTFVVSVVSLPAAFADAVSTHTESPQPSDSDTIGGDVSDDLDADDPTGEPAYPGQGVTDATNDFGYVVEAVLGDRVWDDLNGDGVQDADEPGIPGVAVELLDADGAVVATTATDDDGSYLFDGLLPGDYQARFTAPADMVFTQADQGGDTLDSDADATGLSPVITLAEGDSVLTVDAGLYTPVAIGDLVFDDANGDGTYTDATTDPGLGGVTVELWEDTTGDGVLDTLVDSTTTSSTITDVDGDGVVDPIGSYWFDDLAPGAYGVIVDSASGPLASTGWEQTADPDATLDDETSTPIVLASGESNDAQDFGYFRPAVIGDFVWYDANADGVQDAGEPGIANVTVELLDANGDVIATDTTDASGLYLFEDLPAGDYTVRVDTDTLPAGFDAGDNTFDGAGGDLDSSTDVSVAAGESQTDIDFGYFDPGTIGDTVYHDVDGNGTQGADEPSIEGVTVELLDASGAVIETTVTTADGGYLFTDLAADDYVVRVDTTTLPAAFLPAVNSGDPDTLSDRTNPGDSTSAVDLNDDSPVPAGITDLDQDFGYFIGASVGDRVFEDVDNDGVQDGDEPGFAGVTVELLDAGGTVIGTDVTDADGTYTFDGLPPGDYTVRVVESTLPPGTVQTYEKPATGNTLDGSTDQTLAVGDAIDDVDFGYFRPATVGDVVWNDLDGDGVQDDGEPGVPGVTVRLLDADGAVVRTATTDDNGSYQFTDLIPGEYSVQFELADQTFVFTTPDQGTDDAVDSDAIVGTNSLVATTAPFTLESGDTNTTIDAGLVLTGSLGDRVWSDTNGDGVQGDPALEPGIAGATVVLYEVGNDTPLGSDLTDADGVYGFDDLAPGDYYVVVTPPATDEWLVSPQNVGDDATDSDIDPDGVSDAATVGIGQNVTSVDAGFVPAASLGDRVWQDLDGDGVQDAGEPGVAGVTVELLADPDGDGTFEVVATTTTDGTGTYEFAGLYPGAYQVQFTAPDGNVFSPQSVGDDATDSDADPSGRTDIVLVPAGSDVVTVDAGLIETGSIGDRVWYDADGDGLQGDPTDEPGIAGVTVRLLDATGAEIATDVTDADGLYSFDGLVPGDYTVVFTNTDGTDSYVFTQQDIGTNDSADSDADPTTGATATISLAHGQDIDTVDAGLVTPAAIAGTVTEDIDDDGDGELPLETTIELYADTDGDGAPDGDPIATTTSDPTDGSYSFGGLLPGAYVVVEVNPADYVDVADADSTADGDPLDGDTTVDGAIAVTLTDGETDDGNDFVDELPAAIEVVKTAGDAADGVDYPATGVVGETVTYTFQITNTGVATLSNVTLTDPLPGLTGLACGDPDANGSIVLASGQSATCTALYQLTQADIDAGELTNTASVSGERPRGSVDDASDDVTDTDPAVVTIPQEPALDVVKTTNGVDADAAPGVIVEVGDAVTWTYAVTNTGNTVLADVVVADDQLLDAPVYVSGDLGDDGLLGVGETWVFTATGTATAGQYANLGTATGTPVDADGDPLGLDDVSDGDPDHYYGVDASIDIQKTVALGADSACDAATENVTGSSGDDVTYCFVVTNTGNVPLDDVVVTDPDLLGADELAVADTLLPGESATVSANGTIAGDLVNTATATGTPIDTVSGPSPTPFDPTVVPVPTDDDTASVDETPTIDVVKSNDANGDGNFTDTESQTATPAVEPFRVTFTNAGVDPIVFVGIADAVDGTVRAFTDLACTVAPAAGEPAPIEFGELVPAGATVSCTFTFPVDLTVETEEVDTITVTVADVDDGEEFTDDDTSTVLQPNRGAIGGVIYEDLGGTVGDQDAGDPGIVGAVVTVTPPDGIDAGNGAGVPVELVVSDGTVDVDGDGVADPAGSYHLGDLLPGSYEIDVTLPDSYQQFEDPDGTPDSATVVVLPAGADDLDNDFGYAQPSIDIEKATNGEDADTPTGPFLSTGDAVTWTYTITNDGIVAVSDVVVTDDQVGPITTVVTNGNGDDVLDPGETWVLSAIGVATDGQYANLGTVEGTWIDSTGTQQTDSFDEDPSHYAGVRPAIDVAKTVTLGDTCPGVELVSGTNGTAVVYCFEIVNTGNVPLADVALTDADLGIALTDTTHVSGVAPVAGVLDLAPGERSVFSYAATIDGDLVNTAAVSGTPQDIFTDPDVPQEFPDGLFDDPTDDDTAAVDETPTFTVVKSNDADGDGTFTDTEPARSASGVVPFRVTIENQGADALTFTSITDRVGDEVREMTGLACVLASTTEPIAIGESIPGGDTVTCTFTAIVDLSAGTSDTDVVTVELTDDDGATVPGDDDSTVTGAATISHSKSFDGAIDGDDDGTYTVTYTIEVSNDGTGTGTYDLVDTASFDTDVTILSGAAVVSGNGANTPATPAAWADGAWTLAMSQRLDAGETHTFTLTFEVDAAVVLDTPSAFDPCGDTPTAGTGLFNSAELTVDGEPFVDDACGDLPLLTLDKQGPVIADDLDSDGEIDLGDTLEYTITVINAGAVPLTGVTVDDTIIDPTDLTCLRSDDSAFDHLAGSDLSAGDVVNCTGTYVVTDNDVVAGEVVNVATADSNETPPADDTVTGVVPPAVTLAKAAAAPVSLGDGRYEITYTLTVGNTGTAGTYHLDDTLRFGDGITVDSALVVNAVPGSVTTNTNWNGIDDVVVVDPATPAAIGFGETHVYTVTVQATVDPAIAVPTGVLCPAQGSDGSGGFANTATVSMDDDVVTDDDCVQPPSPDLTIAKQVTSGPTLEDDGTYTIDYLVTVQNTSDGVGLYDLDDTLAFGDGITVLDASIANVLPGTVATSTTWNGVDDVDVVDGATITALETHTFVVAVRADALGLSTPEAGTCSSDVPPTAGGFLNVVTLTSNGENDSADDCVPVPAPGLSITKVVGADSPVSNGDGTYDVTYTIDVVNSEAGPGRYTVADDLAFGDGVEILSVSVSSNDVAADLSGWSGAGVIAADVPITGITTHSYTVVVTVELQPSMTGTARDCDLTGGETGTGLLNTTDLIVAGEVLDEADACVQTPAPSIVVTKNVADDGFELAADGTYSIAYDVLVTNNGAASGEYELDDQLTFGDGITIDTVAISATVPDTLSTNASWNGVDVVDVTTAAVTIDGTDDEAGVQQHVYTIVVTGDASGLVTETAGDCTLDEGEAGTGFLNTATIVVDGVAAQDDACDPNPSPDVTVAKTLTAGPTLNADGTFALEYQLVVTNTGGYGTYDLSDAVAFGAGATVVPDSTTITVVVPGDGSVEAGAGWVGDLWDGVTATTITTGQPIAPGGSQTYTVTLTASIDPLVFDPAASAACPPAGEDATGGFLNVASVTADGLTRSDDACGDVPQPDLELTKNIVSGPTDLGDGTYEIVYDIVVTNNGEGVDAYQLDDELRFGDGVTVIDATVENVAPGSIVVSDTWNGGSDVRVVTDQPIIGLDAHTYRVVATVDAVTILTTTDAACSTTGSLEPGGFLNVALLSSVTTQLVADDCDEVPLPDISVAKAVVGGPAERDGEPGVYDITYDVVVTNVGPGSGRYDLTDDLRFGAGVSVISASIESDDVTTDLSAWNGSGVVTVDEAIATSTTHTYTVTVTAAMAPATLADARDCDLVEGEAGTGLLNVATVSGPLVPTQQADACGEVPNPSIDLAKSLVEGPTLVSGTQYDVSYEIVVTNSGLGLGAYDLVDALAYGGGVTVVSSEIASTDVDRAASAWNGLDITEVTTGVALPATTAHTYTIDVRIDVAPGIVPDARDCVLGEGEAGTGVLNTATVVVPGVAVPPTDTACGDIPDPDISVDKTSVSGPTLEADGTYSLVYEVVVTNDGEGPGTYDLVDQPDFGPAISIVSAVVESADAVLPAPATWDPAVGAFTVAAGVPLVAGESDTYTMTFVATIDPATIDDTAGVCTAGHASTESEFFNRATVSVDGQVVDNDEACEPAPVPNLEIAKSVSPGSLTYRSDGIYDVVYTITVTNSGNGPTSYTLTDEFAFADGVDVLDVAVTAKPASATLTSGFDGVTRTEVARAPLPATTVHTYRIAITVDTKAVVDQQAFDCDLDDGETGTGLLNRAQVNPTDEACVEIPTSADLELRKVASQPSVTVGDEVTFTLYVTNNGPVDASDVTVRDILPDGLEYVSQSGDGRYAPATGIWTIGDLAVGELVEIDLVVIVEDEGTITNQAEVWSSSEPDPDSTPANGKIGEDDQDSASVTGTAIVVQQPPVTPPPATLPPTGGETRSPLTIASWLIVGGLGLVLMAARRRSRRLA